LKSINNSPHHDFRVLHCVGLVAAQE